MGECDVSAKPKEVTTAMVRAALRKRYPAGEYGLFEEVGNGTGSRCRRHADAVAMGFWPSRGIYLSGFEIKVSRYDWAKELRNPEKADDIAKFCDFWWLVVGDESIVKEGELPPTWGLLVYSGGTLRSKTDATKLEHEPLDRNFIAALLRRAHEAQEKVRQEALREGREAGEAQGPEEHMRALKKAQDETESYKSAIATFEEKSGIKIERWHAGDVGDAVASLRKLKRQWDPSVDEVVEQAARELDAAAEKLRRAHARLAEERAIAAKTALEVA
jgi:hypothetical protein